MADRNPNLICTDLYRGLNESPHILNSVQKIMNYSTTKSVSRTDRQINRLNDRNFQKKTVKPCSRPFKTYKSIEKQEKKIFMNPIRIFSLEKKSKNYQELFIIHSLCKKPLTSDCCITFILIFVSTLVLKISTIFN